MREIDSDRVHSEQFTWSSRSSLQQGIIIDGVYIYMYVCISYMHIYPRLDATICYSSGKFNWKIG